MRVTYVCFYVCLYVRVNACVWLRVCACMCAFNCVCMCLFVCVWLHACVRVCWVAPEVLRVANAWGAAWELRSRGSLGYCRSYLMKDGDLKVRIV